MRPLFHPKGGGGGWALDPVGRRTSGPEGFGQCPDGAGHEKRVQGMHASDWLCCPSLRPLFYKTRARLAQGQCGGCGCISPLFAASILPRVGGTAGQTRGPAAEGRRGWGAGDAGLPHQRLRPGGPGRVGGTRIPAAAAAPGARVVPSAPIPKSDLDPNPGSGLIAARSCPRVGGLR